MPDKKKDNSDPLDLQLLSQLPKEAMKEMQAAVDAAWDNPDPVARARQRQLFPHGKPSVPEFIRVMAEEIKKSTE